MSEKDGKKKESKGAIRLGRKGDPRMHKAVTARLADPKLSLVDALRIGGFEIASGAEGEHMMIDGVTLSQRKNQLSRRLRLERQNLDQGLEEIKEGKATEKDNESNQGASSSTFMNAASLLDQQQGLSKFIARAAGSIGLQVPPTSPGGVSVGSTGSSNPLHPSRAFSNATLGSILNGTGIQGGGGHAEALLSQMQLSQAAAGGASSLGSTPIGNIGNSVLLQQQLLAGGRAGVPNGTNPTFTANLLQLMQQQQLQQQKIGSTNSQGDALKDDAINQIQQQITRQMSQDNFNTQQSIRAVASALAGRMSPALFGVSPVHSRSPSLTDLVNLQQQLQSQQRPAVDFSGGQTIIDSLRQLSGANVGTTESRENKASTNNEPTNEQGKAAPSQSATENSSQTKDSKKRPLSSSGNFEILCQLNDPVKRRMTGTKLSSAAALTSVLQSDTEQSDQEEQDIDNLSDAGSLYGNFRGNIHNVSKKEGHQSNGEGKTNIEVTKKDDGGVSGDTHVKEQIPAINGTNGGAQLDGQKVLSALQYYQAQNNAILKRAMIHAKFDVLEIDDTSTVFQTFFSLALEAENRRLAQLKSKSKA